jgi:hypothetical protein
VYWLRLTGAFVARTRHRHHFKSSTTGVSGLVDEQAFSELIDRKAIENVLMTVGRVAPQERPDRTGVSP